jgi:hypothetical protein
MSARVLLVTDYAGALHIVPLGNKAYYESRNKIIRNKQFRLREMNEADALEEIKRCNGVDESFGSTPEADRKLANKDAEIEALKKKLAKLEALQNAPKGKGSKGKRSDDEDETQDPDPESQNEKQLPAIGDGGALPPLPGAE